jgi:NhaP-type Na+/H+ or K+/H+ antiporter
LAAAYSFVSARPLLDSAGGLPESRPGQVRAMDIDVVLASLGALGLVVAALSLRIRRLPLSEPLLALVVGVVLGPEVVGALTLPPVTEDHHLLHEASRLLLAVSVMAVALRYPFREVRRRLGPVVVLLLVAMPVMAVVTAALGWALVGLPVAAALLLGAALAPTDPVLASSVVTGEPAEEDLPERDRQVLSLESGANDGLALPLVVAAIAVAGPLGGLAAVGESLWQVLGGTAVGVAVGWLGGKALRAGERHRDIDQAPRLLFTALLALAVLGAAGLLHVDGILAVFAGGLAFNVVGTGSDRVADVSIDEAINRFAVLPVFIVLGAALPWREWASLGWTGPAMAVAVLLLRRVPVLLLLGRPLRLGRADAAYLGWFGPVGVSAVFYLTLEAQRLGVDKNVLAVGVLVVAASTVAHGLTSAPGRVLYRKATRGHDGARPVAGDTSADHA